MAWLPMRIKALISPASGWRSGFGATNAGSNRHGGHSARKETPAASYVLQSRREGQEESDEDNPIIIAEAETVVHEMAVSDAVMQMDLSDQPFVLFRNASSGEINVVYRRDDGHVGWIDPSVRQKTQSRR